MIALSDNVAKIDRKLGGLHISRSRNVGANFGYEEYKEYCCASTVVALGYTRSVRRLQQIATDHIPIFDATSALQWVSHSAVCAR